MPENNENIVSPGNPDPNEENSNPGPTPDPVPEELATQILAQVTLVTKVEDGQQIEEVTIPESLFSSVDALTVDQIRDVLEQNNPTDDKLNFLKGFSPTSPLYPMKLVRNVDTDEIEIIKLPENIVWSRCSWTNLQNPNEIWYELIKNRNEEKGEISPFSFF